MKNADGNEVGTYTITHGNASGTWKANANWTPALEDCTEYTWTCKVEPITEGKDALGIDGTANKPATPQEYGTDGKTKGTVHVLYPTVNARDEFIYWGETKNPDTLITVANDWTDQDNSHGKPNLIGEKPTITKEAAFQAGENSNTPSKDSDYNVIAKIGDRDITQLLRDHNRIVPDQKAHASCDDTSVGAGLTDKDFRIHVKVKKLTVQKIVEGNMGDTNQEFTFTGDKIYTADKAEVNDGFKLKHDGEQQFKLKVGEEAKITETAAAGYTTTIAVDPNAGTISGTEFKYSVTKNSPDAVTVTYTNTKQITPPNGITTTIAPYAIMVVLAAGAGVYFVYSRRSRNR